jgi:lipopolysaccharide export system protein LptA
MIEADGHVVLVSKTSRIIGDKAIYDVDKGAAIITGDKLRATSKDQYVTARDSLEYWEAQGAVIARGDAVAANPQQQVYADLLTGYFRPDASGTKKLYQVEANGNVRILSKGNVARCLKAVYNLENDVATLEGGVKITRGQNQLNGERAVYNLKTGQAKVTAGGTGGRVKTLLVPGSDTGGGILKP